MKEASPEAGEARPTPEPADARELSFLAEPGARSPGSLTVAELVDSLEGPLTVAVDRVARRHGRTAADCPWLDRYLTRYRRASPDEVRRLVRRWIGGSPQTPEALRQAVISRAVSGAEGWFARRRIPFLPGASSVLGLLGLGERRRRRQYAAADPSRPGSAVAARRAMDRLGQGHPLPETVRRPAEQSYGAHLAHVRVHTGDAGAGVAQAAGAHALAFGDEIAFARGRYRPDTVVGRALVAHELAHVVQQSRPATAGSPERDADRAAVHALAGKPASVGGVGGIRAQGCGGRDAGMNAQEAASKHWRIVFREGASTQALVSGVYKYVLVAASDDAAASGWAAGKGDTVINFNGLNYPRLSAVSYRDPPAAGGQWHHQRPQRRIGAYKVHFMSPGTYLVRATVHPGRGLPAIVLEQQFEVAEANFAKASRAAIPDDISTLSPRRSLQEERIAWYMHRAGLRRQARTAGVIGAATDQAWINLSAAVVIQASAMEQSRSTTLADIGGAVKRLLDAVKADGGSIVLPALAEHLKSTASGTSVSAFREAMDGLSSGFDSWILHKIQSAKGEDSKLYKQYQHSMRMDRELRGIRSRARGEAIKIPAVYHPKHAYAHQGLLPTQPMNTGAIQQVPLSLWLFEDGPNDWTLRDVTNPEKTFEYDITTTSRSTAIDNLLSQYARDDEHFPRGMLYVHPPGEKRRELAIESSMSFTAWLGVFAVALAAMGLIAITAGAATPGVVAAGGYMLTASAVLGGAVAVIDTIDAYERGRLTAGRFTINALQLVASVATAGSTTILARTASQGGTALQGIGSNARYIFLNRAATSADVVTLVVMGADTAAKLDHLSRSGSETAGAAALLLVGQFLIQGSLTIVAARNDFRGDLGSHPHIVLDEVDGQLVIRGTPELDGVPVGAVRGTDVHPTTNTRTVDGNTRGGLGPGHSQRELSRVGDRLGGARVRQISGDAFELTVPTTPPTVVDIRLQRAMDLPDATAHVPPGGAAGTGGPGPARLSLQPPAAPNGRWTATITLDSRLPRENARVVLGHEIDEISDIFLRGNTATIAVEMEASLMRRGLDANSTPHITAHDRAAASELFDLQTQRAAMIRERDQLVANSGRNAQQQARLDVLNERIPQFTNGISAHAHHLGLDQPQHLQLKVDLLRQAATDPAAVSRIPSAQREAVLTEWHAMLHDFHVMLATPMIAGRAGTFGAGRSGPAVLTADNAAHLAFPEPHAPVPRSQPGRFRERGIHGGHEDAQLHRFVDDNPGLGYVLVNDASYTDPATGTTYRRYTQWMYTGTGAPPGPPPATPGGNWVRAKDPKTTVDNLPGFLNDAEYALWRWTRHPSRLANFHGTTPVAYDGNFAQKLPGGPHIGGFFAFTPPGNYTIRTVFIEASWIQ